MSGIQERDEPTPYTSYKDLHLRRPRSDFQVRNVEVWLADILDLPKEAVRLVLRSGNHAEQGLTLGALREDWNR